MIAIVCPCCGSTNVDKDTRFSSSDDFKCVPCGAEFDKNQAGFEEV